MKTIMEPASRSAPADASRSAATASRAAPPTPTREGFAERDGQRLFYEVYGEGEETLFLLPTWSLVHSRHWKMQIPYFARHFRVLTMDGLGNGRSDRCRDPRRYGAGEFARDCLAVMDATGTERAVMASLSRGAQYLLELARLAPERVAGAAFIGPLLPLHAVPLVGPADRRPPAAPHAGRRPIRWWGHMNAARWRRGLPGVRGVVHLAVLLGAALDQGHRGRRGLGAWTPTPRR